MAGGPWDHRGRGVIITLAVRGRRASLDELRVRPRVAHLGSMLCAHQNVHAKVIGGRVFGVCDYSDAHSRIWRYKYDQDVCRILGA